MLLVRIICIVGLLFGSTLWASVGKVALLKGEAVAERNAQTITLQNGTLIEEKDAIKTGKEAQVQLLFEDKTVITLGSESEFKIEEYINDTQNPKAKFKFSQGSFKTITGKIGKTAPQNFTMETKTSTIGIRGTIVKGSTGDSGDLIACLRGHIVVISRDTGKMVEIPAGQFTTVKPNEAPATPKETQPGTTDESLVKNTTSPTQSPAPAVVSTVEDVKNVALVTQTNSFPVGTIQLNGLTTSDGDDLALTFTLDKATAKTTGMLGGYNLASPVNGVIFRDSYSESYEGMSSTWFVVVNYDPTTYVDTDEYGEPYATNISGYDKYSVIHSNIAFHGEAFWRGGFINNEGVLSGYFGNEDNYGSMSITNSEYVTWGIWGTLPDYNEDYGQNIWLADQHYWVGGAQITPESKIQSLMSHNSTYTYEGYVMGKTFNGSSWNQINQYTSNVNLIFDFGSTSTINSSSSISFSSYGGDSWVLKPTNSSITATGFNSSVATGTNGGTVNVGTGAINGLFFGSEAQAIGGTLKATESTDANNPTTAVGVFKAVR